MSRARNPDNEGNEKNMNVQEAVMAFSQSEKIKSGIIWVSHVLCSLEGVAERDARGAAQAMEAILGMLTHEIRCAEGIAGPGRWLEAEKHIDKALVMISSGVAPESVPHLTAALSLVTDVGQRAMTVLREQGLA